MKKIVGKGPGQFLYRPGQGCQGRHVLCLFAVAVAPKAIVVEERTEECMDDGRNKKKSIIL